MRQVHRSSERVSACSKMDTPSAISDNVVFRYAYVEFSEPEHIDAALTMDNSLFRGRLIKVNTVGTFMKYRFDKFFKVTAKRTNVPGFIRGRGRGRPGYRGGYRGYAGYSPYRGRGR